MKLILLVIYCALNLVKSQDLNEAEKTFIFLDEGTQDINLNNKEDLILVIGTTGTGKSTLIKFISGDNTKLLVKKSGRNLVFFDNEEKISSSTLISKTIFPDVTIDQKTNEALVDFAGFSDTRNETLEIGSSYFLKKVLDRTKHVKFLITVTHSSVSSTVERLGINDFLKHISQLFDNFEKFKKSATLIVTKVNHEYDDKDEIELIKEFLFDCKNDQEKLYKSIVEQGKGDILDGILAVKKIKLLNIFSDKTLNNIGLFRTPKTIGVVSESPFLQSEKVKLRKIIFDDTEYTRTTEGDFSLVISPKSQLYINTELTKSVHLKLDPYLKDLLSNILLTFDKRAIKSSNHETFKNSVVAFSRKLPDITKDVLLLKLFIIDSIKFIETTYYSESNIKKFIANVEYFQFFNSFVSDEKSSYLPIYVNELSVFKNKLDYLVNWYTFLIDFKNSLTSYDFQSKIANYDQYFPNQLTFNDLLDFDKFRDKIIKFPLKSNNAILAISSYNYGLKPYMVNEINKILLFNLQTKVQLNCENSKFTAKGNYIVLQNIVSAIKSCSNLKSISIFASHTIFIDSDLTCNSVNLKLISPKISVIENRKFDVSGVSGNNQVAAKDGTYPGAPGDTGKPGNTGQSSGNVLIICQQLESGNRLSIIANGGNGGDGQNGGNGFKGTSADTPPIINDSDQDSGYFKKKVERKGYIPIKDENYGNKYYWRVRNTNGYTQPGNGGNGGVGGKPGNIGEISVITESSHEIRLTQIAGKTGTGGRGGLGSKEIYQAQDREHICTKVKHTMCAATGMGGAPCGSYYKYECEGQSKVTKAQRTDSNDGLGNYNSNGLNTPNGISLIEVNFEILNYKTYFRENLNTFQSIEFLSFLYTNFKIIQKCSLTCYLKEFLEIEKQYYILFKKSIPVKEHYNLLKSSIEMAVKNNYISDSMYEFKILDVALQTKLSPTFHQNIIVDLHNYIQISLNKIKDVESRSKSIVIVQNQETFSTELKVLIDQVHEFTENQVEKEIMSIKTSINSAIESLFSETDQLEKDLHTKKLELVEQEYQMQENMKKIAFFGFLNSLTAGIGVFQPSVGAVLGSSLGIAEGLFVKPVDISNINDKPVVPGSISAAAQNIDKFFKSSRESALNELILALDHVLEIGEGMSKYSSQVENAKSRIKQLKDNTDYTNINATKNHASNIISELKTIVSTNASQNTTFLTAVKFLEKTERLFKVGDTAIKYLQKYQTEENKAVLINNAIKKVDEELKSIAAYEEQIYTTIGPLFSQMYNDLTKSLNYAQNENQISLQISQWKIQSYLKEIKNLIHKFTRDFKVELDFLHCFSRLEELINLVINLLDRAQNYQYQQKLTKFITEVNRANFESLVFTNSEFRNNYDKLIATIQANILLDEYNKIKTSFEQQIFPFAAKEIQILNLDTERNNLNEIIHTVKRNIESIRDMLIKMKSSISNSLDTSVILAEFNTNFISSAPFYVWNSKKFGYEINDFLSGLEVTVKADIFDVKSEYNAIKFNLIELNIITINPALQSELNTILYNFTVEMTHFGNSYYKCANTYYLVHGIPFKIIHGFERRNDVPVTRNAVYDKIKDRDIFMSPYTMWGLKLVPKSDQDLRLLRKFKSQVNLELIGKGQYVMENAKVCLEDLNNYYDVYFKIEPNTLVNHGA